MMKPVKNRMEVADDCTSQLEKFIERYAKHGKAINVNFRRLVASIPYNSERATHFIHPYPAKLLLHIPFFFLNNQLLSKKNDLVLDPFCGSGTVLLESLLNSRRARGIDANPLARIISKAKTTTLQPDILSDVAQSLLSHSPKRRTRDHLDVVNLEHWFYPHVIRQLKSLWCAIDGIADSDIKDFFSVCFSHCVRRVSLADPRIAVPVRLNPSRYPKSHWLHQKATQRLNRLRRINVQSLFSNIAEANIERMKVLTSLTDEADVSVIGSDSRDITQFRDLLNQGAGKAERNVQLIITSPPYAGAQKYIRSSCLSLGWLQLCPSTNLRSQEANSVGREHYQMFLTNMLWRHGIRNFDAIYSEPTVYKDREKTKFSSGDGGQVRQVMGLEGSHASNTSNDILIIGSGYDDELISRIGYYKDSARKVQILGLPSLRADMYQENELRALEAEDNLGASLTFFAPANDPFVTASVISEITSHCEKQFPLTNLYLSPLASKAQVLGFSLFYQLESHKRPTSIIYPFKPSYSRETTSGISRIWKYVVEV